MRRVSQAGKGRIGRRWRLTREHRLVVMRSKLGYLHGVSGDLSKKANLQCNYQSNHWLFYWDWQQVRQLDHLLLICRQSAVTCLLDSLAIRFTARLKLSANSGARRAPKNFETIIRSMLAMSTISCIITRMWSPVRVDLRGWRTRPGYISLTVE